MSLTKKQINQIGSGQYHISEGVGAPEAEIRPPKNNLGKTMNNAFSQLTQVFPPVGGVTPSSVSENTMQRLSRKNTGLAEQILQKLNLLRESSRNVGLDLTINDPSRPVRIMAEDKQVCLPPIYKGVSYNPNTNGQEWLMLLDFFALMRETQNQLEIPWRLGIMDAGLYWIVNALGKNGIAPTQKRPFDAAESIRRFLIEQIKDPQFAEIMKTINIRGSYLEALSREFPANSTPPVFSVFNVWFSPSFSNLLAEALKLFCKFKDGRWQVERPVSYERYMPYSPWVTPLVCAEQAWVAQQMGFLGMLAPVQEAAWNSALDQMFRKVKIPLPIQLMYVRRIGKQLPYNAIPTFSDDEATIATKLGRREAIDCGLTDLICKLVSPFVGKTLMTNDPYLPASIREFTLRVETNASKWLNEYRQKEVQASEDNAKFMSLLEQTGWLSSFPPGTC